MTPVDPLPGLPHPGAARIAAPGTGPQPGPSHTPDPAGSQAPDPLTAAAAPTVRLTLPRPAPAAPDGQGTGPLYVVGDVHGHLDELLAELRAHGLVDAAGHWAAGNARLWFLGDFTDRGPDGVGVIDLVMGLAAEAAAAGGYARALMGNHEVLLLGAHRFGDTPINSASGTTSFLACWRLNGGRPSDMERLADHHVTWLSRLPAAAVADDHLLVHSDATTYLEYGDSVDAVNDTVHQLLATPDPDRWWDHFRRLTKRFAFRGPDGVQAVHRLLDAYGGRRLVHGHSPIPHLAELIGPDGEEIPEITAPYVYADGLVIAMDAGVTINGRLLVHRLT
ncbi:metallophosphoesterase [Allostreptomyces psammosilenae]|uniref:Calcineurin-like phosphoesterase domain-containing protein n=1 Tax=Allostreptomyces psammosilenae TaxID=1892865 RepID=A0A853A418_9ACTN|nr:metallophosphoesterase [Allostreptomyces psammosilenae]NYI05451.1 hypothetical protein [Allostreptomyces psammosilenae]